MRRIAFAEQGATAAMGDIVDCRREHWHVLATGT